MAIQFGMGANMARYRYPQNPRCRDVDLTTSGRSSSRGLNQFACGAEFGPALRERIKHMRRAAMRAVPYAEHRLFRFWRRSKLASNRKREGRRNR